MQVFQDKVIFGEGDNRKTFYFPSMNVTYIHQIAKRLTNGNNQTMMGVWVD